MYYIKLIILYSLLGFILESVVYKIGNDNKHSSIFYGPYTFVYGFGMLFCILIYNYLNNILNNTIFTYLLYYILFTLITTTTEFLGGNIIHYFLKIDKWNYSNHKYHFGKYICLDYAIYWGLLSLFTIIYLHPYFNKNIILTISNNTIVIFIIIILIDLIFIIKNKILKKEVSTTS